VSAYAHAFPAETPSDQHGHLKNEMADRVVDKITATTAARSATFASSIY
jgi:hypothetical protein